MWIKYKGLYGNTELSHVEIAWLQTVVGSMPTKAKGNIQFLIPFSFKYPTTRSSKQFAPSVISLPGTFLSQFYLFHPLEKCSQTSNNTDEKTHTETCAF